MALTKAQRTRLEKLATYLEGLPKRYRHFEMSVYYVADDDEGEAKYALENGGLSCGTVACAVGHGPAAGILFPSELVRPRLYGGGFTVDWNRYAELFGNHFGWLFSGEWADVDNHHYGAAAHIRFLLEKGVPADWEYDRKTVRLYAPYRIDAKASA